MSLTNMIADIAQADIAPPARDVCLTAPAAGPWPPLPNASEAADACFARLIDEGRLEEATRFVAAWLGPRRAVWWATLCVWNGLRSASPGEGDMSAAAIDAAVTWVIDPTEINRRAAQDAAERVGFATPAGAAATGAFWSEGSISLPGQPAVPPPQGVAVKAAANAVLMAAAAPAASQRDATLRQSLRIAAEVLAGANLWTTGTIQ